MNEYNCECGTTVITDAELACCPVCDDAALANDHPGMVREIAELDALVQRQAELLDGVANALKGEPDELTSHSWHDLPELARIIKEQRDEIHKLMYADESKIVFATRNGVIRTAVGECEPGMQYRLIRLGTHL